jgi:hypothetical protein
MTRFSFAPKLPRFALAAALAATTACGAAASSAPDPAPAVKTEAINYMMLVTIPADFATGSAVATIDVPTSLLAQSDSSSPKILVPVTGATLTLKNGNVLPLVGSIDSLTLVATLTTSNNLYKITLNLLKDKKNPDGTFATTDGKVGGISVTSTVAPATPKLWCGFFNGDEKGWLKLQTNLDGSGSGPIQGSFDDGSGVTTVKGSVVSNKVTLTIQNPEPGFSGGGTGAIDAGVNMSGVWSNSDKQKGQWSVTTFGCSG